MSKTCPNITCGSDDKCCKTFEKYVIPAAMGDDSEGSEVAPCNGAYKNALVEYEANGALYIYSSEGIFTRLYYVASEITGAATVQYVKKADSTVLKAAKDYTNTAIAQMNPTTKAYVDEQDALTLQEAKAYADQAVGSGVTQAYVDTQDAATLSTAKNYADSKDTTTLQSAKDYTDNTISAAIAADQAQQIKLVLTDTDPGEGSPLSANTLLGVYRGE